MPAVIPIIAAVASVGATVAGVVMQSQAAKQNAAYQEQAIAAQQRAEAARQQAMELDAQRKQLEIVRTQQRARAMALAAATSSGTAFNSGLQGGYGQISGQTNTNALGVQQSLDLGRNIFSANSDYNIARIGEANAQSMFSLGGSIGGFGRTLMSDYGQVKSMGQDFGRFFG